MNYRTMIQNRKSVRAFTDRRVPDEMIRQIKSYFKTSAKRLVSDLRFALLVFDDSARSQLEGAAGYNNFLVGAPHYMVLLSDKHPLAHINAGFVMQDLVLNLTDMGLDTCWVTFTDSERVKEELSIFSEMDIVAIVAFGYGQKTTKRLRLNIFSMSNVDISAKRQYVEPKRSVNDMVFLDSWGNNYKVNEYIGFFDDVLWESFYAASLAPSYLNRQAYGFVIRDGLIHLIARPDAYNTEIDGDLSLGIAMLHFSAVAEEWTGKVIWYFENTASDLQLPEGHRLIASCSL